MSRFPHLAQRLFNVPLAIHPRKTEIVMAALAGRLGIGNVSMDGHVVRPQALLDGDMLGMAEEAEDKPYMVAGGVACIPIEGTLVNKLGTMQPYSGMTGYDGIRGCLALAMANDDVEAIMLDIDSPGGEVAGCFDLVDDIYGARGSKPIWAVLSESAYSAAYAIASAADRIIVPRTGGIGSVGVICLHVDMSKALDKAGFTVTLIRYGQQKYEGNAYEPLTKGALDRIQADTDAMGELFVETVARNRGLKASAVRATQAGTFLGADGVGIGFADAVASPNEAFADLLRTI